MTLIIPLRVGAGLNSREHPMARHRRVKKERATVALFVKVPLTSIAQSNLGKAFDVELTRVSPGNPDDDQVVGSLKAVRDEVAKWLGVDDGSRLVKFRYEHKKRGKGVYAVEIRVTVARSKWDNAWDELDQQAAAAAAAETEPPAEGAFHVAVPQGEELLAQGMVFHSTKVKP